jgi:SAM-dependent methyltransferase
MENITRKPFQGVLNIVRFNWHFYVIICISGLLIYFSKQFVPDYFKIYIIILLLGMMLSTLITLLVSFYVYDFSPLYKLNFLDNLGILPNANLVNINAGFDETSHILVQKFPKTNLEVFDFYDPSKHTEISIERARKRYAPYPNTKVVETSKLPLSANSVDYIFVIFAAHEIRNMDERILFFQQITDSLKPNGKIIVVEHLRDLPNFLAYNIGFLHFFAKSEWKKTFNTAQLSIHKEVKLTPFISAFFLEKHGITS